MSDPSAPSPATPPPKPPAKALGRGVGWFFVISGGILVILTLGCIVAVSSGNSGDTELGLICGSPTLLLGGLFLWLGTRRLKR